MIIPYYFKIMNMIITFKALLILFWPELSKSQREAVLENVEPLLKEVSGSYFGARIVRRRRK